MSEKDNALADYLLDQRKTLLDEVTRLEFSASNLGKRVRETLEALGKARRTASALTDLLRLIGHNDE